MMPKRSMPPGTIMPELIYDDVETAAAWLCRAFGFTERLRLGRHRAQLVLDGAALIVAGRPADAVGPAAEQRHALLVRVADVDADFGRVRNLGARIVSPPADQAYGERQYSVDDPGGHRWTFSQSIADVDPRAWGGEPRAGLEGGA